MAFVDDVYVATPIPDRVGPIYTRGYVPSRPHPQQRSTTQVWNAAGIRPRACDELERIAQEADPTARVWRVLIRLSFSRASQFWAHRWAALSSCRPTGKFLSDLDTLLSRIPLLDDTQSAWALLLHCAGSRENYLLRLIRPELVQHFAEGHNAGLWRCLARILPASTGADPIAKTTASLPLSMGGLGLRDAFRTSEPAF